MENEVDEIKVALEVAKAIMEAMPNEISIRSLEKVIGRSVYTFLSCIAIDKSADVKASRLIGDVIKDLQDVNVELIKIGL